jgi:hypothetical protein
MSANNLYAVYEQCTPQDRADAINSYFRYQEIMRAVSKRFDVSLATACGVFSALSPNNDYDGNVRDLVATLDAARRGLALEDFRVATYGNNKRKAYRIAQGASPEDEIVALKTRNFYHNILDPNDPNYVTIDGHMYWAWMGRRGSVTGRRKHGIGSKVKGEGANVSVGIYREIAGDTIGLSRALQLIPNQLQAIIWVTWKRIHNKKYAAQTEFFPSDHVAAGIIDLGQKRRTIKALNKPPSEMWKHPELRLKWRSRNSHC